MADSKKTQLEGEALISHVETLTGLPEEIVKDEMSRVLDFLEGPRENATLEQFRSAVLAYLAAMRLESEEAPSNEAH
jgi:hypothetical protein